jgi:hypothetical protein
MKEQLLNNLEDLRSKNKLANIPLVWDEEIRIMLRLKGLGCSTVFNGLNIDEQINERQKLKLLFLNLRQGNFNHL